MGIEGLKGGSVLEWSEMEVLDRLRCRLLKSKVLIGELLTNTRTTLVSLSRFTKMNSI